MGVKASCRNNQAFARKRFGARSHCESWCHAVHGLGVACFTDCVDFTVLDADVGFVNAGVVDDQRIGDYCVRRFGIQLR